LIIFFTWIWILSNAFRLVSIDKILFFLQYDGALYD
jgi:hypothetical protein